MNLWGETMYARPSLNFEVCTPAAHPTLSIRLNGGGGEEAGGLSQQTLDLCHSF